MKKVYRFWILIFGWLRLGLPKVGFISGKKSWRTILEIIFANNRKSRAINFIQMFKQIITHFVGWFTECIWNQNFSLFYNVCGAIKILFELAANAFFSINASSLFRTLMKKDYNQEKFKLNHNVVMKLLQKKLRKSW